MTPEEAEEAPMDIVCSGGIRLQFGAGNSSDASQEEEEDED